MPIRLLDERETRSLIDVATAIARCRDAYGQTALGTVEQPDVLTIEVREHQGEVHAKGGYLHGAPFFSIKVATGFYRNPERGLPVTSGAVWVFDATTGFLDTIIVDRGFLTELRTGAAGAVAADLLARKDIRTVGIVGSGGQARYQLEALLAVRRPERILVAGRSPERVRAYADEMTARIGCAVTVAPSVEALARESDLIVTTTPAESPVLRSEWIRPGTHITAMGSDMPHKRELDGPLLARAKLVVDRLSQCLTQGELHHAVLDGVLRPEDVYAELGEIAAGRKPGRTNETEITIADQTGLGILDAAVASVVASRARAENLGRWLDV